MPTMPSGNHESFKSKIPKRKKARSNIPLSCKIQYYIKTNFAYFSARSAFFTDDSLLLRLLNRLLRRKRHRLGMTVDDRAKGLPMFAAEADHLLLLDRIEIRW
jgi:hypothetical protein